MLLTLPVSASAQTPKLKVMGSFYPLYEWARQVGGERIEAVNLVSVGAEPHEYEPNPRDIRRIHEMDIAIDMGASFQPGLDRVLRGVRGRKPIRLTVSEGMSLRPMPGSGKDAPPDMHIWLDPVLSQQMVKKIAAVLAQADPPGRTIYEANAEAYAKKLEALDREYSAGLAACQHKEVITSHAAFAYFLERYGLRQFAIRGLSPNTEPSPRQLARLATLAKERGIKAIYYETLVSPKIAETLAREVGAKTVVLNPIEGLTTAEQAQGKDYLALMRDNLANLRIGQECGP
jgi:zinc transport system substrate-binding protein